MKLSLPGLSFFGKINEKFDVSTISSVASPVVAIIVSVVIVVFIVWPKFSEGLKLKKDNKELEVRAMALEVKAEKLKVYNRQELDEQLIAADKLLPSDKDVFTFVGQVEKAAGVSGVLLSRFDLVPGNISESSSSEKAQQMDKKPESVPEQSASSAQSAGSSQDSASSLKISVTINSDYNGSMKFLSTLLGLSRAVSLDDLSIGSSTSSNIISINFILNAYWQPLLTVLPSIESPILDLTSEEIKRLQDVSKAGSENEQAETKQVPLGRTDLFAPF